jgi:hypothetical protein
MLGDSLGDVLGCMHFDLAKDEILSVIAALWAFKRARKDRTADPPVITAVQKYECVNGVREGVIRGNIQRELQVWVEAHPVRKAN